MSAWDKAIIIVEDLAMGTQQYMHKPVDADVKKDMPELKVVLPRESWNLVQDALGTLITVDPSLREQVELIYNQIAVQIIGK